MSFQQSQSQNKMLSLKFLFLFSALCFLSSILHPSQAYAAGFGKGPVKKLTRGFVYLVSSPFQIPKGMIQAAAETEPVWIAPERGATVGTGQGLYDAFRQISAGLWDIFTFWTPAARNWAPLFEPNTLWPEL